jgi:hypothetical protein
MSLATKESLKANNQTVEIGDDLAIPGLFVPHYGQDRNIPIVRMGTVAAPAEEKLWAEMGKNWFERIDAYLIEMRSIGGLSGSPVLIHRYDESGEKRQSTWGLLGLMQGHCDAFMPATAPPLRESINMGVGIVVTADDIDKVLSQSNILELETRSEEESLRRVVRLRENPRNEEPTK